MASSQTRIENAGATPSGSVIIINPLALQVGDIVLSTDMESAISALIRVTTRSDFSHAAICTRVGLLMEANLLDSGLNGVWRCSAMRVMATDPKSLKILRLDPSVRDREAIAKEAAAKAEWMLSRLYWDQGAKKYHLPGIPVNPQGAFFCSHLVAMAYEQAGVRLLQAAPEKTAPGDLAKSEFLVDASADVLVLEDEAAVQASLPVGMDEDGPQRRIEAPIEQQLTANAEVVEIVNRHRLPPAPGYWDLMMRLARTRDAGLDEIMLIAFGRVMDGYRRDWPTRSLRPRDLDEWKKALFAGAYSVGRVRSELRLAVFQMAVLEQDIRDRQEDVKQNDELRRLAPEIRTFKARWSFSKEYLEHMRSQRRLLKRRIDLLSADLEQRPGVG